MVLLPGEKEWSGLAERGLGCTGVFLFAGLGGAALLVTMLWGRGVTGFIGWLGVCLLDWGGLHGHVGGGDGG